LLGLLTLSAALITIDAKQSVAQTSKPEPQCSEATLDQPGSGDIAKIAASLNDIWKLKVRLFLCTNRLDGIAYATSDGTIYFHDGRDITLLPTRKQQTFASWFLLAHEWGHQVQYRTYPPSQFTQVSHDDPPVFELQADCLAGYALGNLIARGIDIPFAMNAVTWKLGDAGGPGSHGNPMQRQAAFSRGLAGTGYTANLTVGPAPQPLKQSWNSACDTGYFRHGIREKAETWKRWSSTTETPR
jgi:hypothetical protein